MADRRSSSIPNNDDNARKQNEAVAKEVVLDKVISYVLIGGVILSVILEITGISLYFSQNKSFMVELETEQWQLKGADFFSYLWHLLTSLFYGQQSTNIGYMNSIFPIKIMALGVLTLMLTPFVRVVASAIFFGYQKDSKYLMITFFVLVVLTLSLLTH
jgi:uncharacterized membrane protein